MEKFFIPDEKLPELLTPNFELLTEITPVYASFRFVHQASAHVLG